MHNEFFVLEPPNRPSTPIAKQPTTHPSSFAVPSQIIRDGERTLRTHCRLEQGPCTFCTSATRFPLPQPRPQVSKRMNSRATEKENKAGGIAYNKKGEYEANLGFVRCLENHRHRQASPHLQKKGCFVPPHRVRPGNRQGSLWSRSI